VSVTLRFNKERRDGIGPPSLFYCGGIPNAQRYPGMTPKQRLSALRQLRVPITPETFPTIESRRQWVAKVVPLLNFNNTYHDDVREAADIFSRPGFSSTMYDQVAARIELIIDQAITELENDLTPAEAKAKQGELAERTHDLAYVFHVLNTRGRFYFGGLFLGVIVASFAAGVKATNIAFVREYAGITIPPTIVTREVAVSSKRNPELDKKIEAWIDANEKRISEIHSEIMHVEENSRLLAGNFGDVQKDYANQVLRLKDSMAKEQDAFARNLTALEELKR